ncbi:aspartate kinase [Hydrogenoanaerobacterium saccharovorans]|uniref:Aspartokinase n=1 Tax=Hydrogenoanaerobacterium saccharovorans TaxID=474960 RepID=A0ABS2GKB0_9FIRM|nr:aspartate kinase [Hydrogenoanaerobacterium saccharovorans]MBM6922566.1 aspartate kinase [Hydrogenoanaerobacterium saccharovorans]HIY81962.1 aspartate kinase [Bacillota bacterium]
MALIVQKFGGSSVADAQRVSHVAGIIANTYRQGNQVVVVVSAQGKTTDHLIAQAQEVNPNPSKRELDALMATGELASMALMALALERLGMPAISLSGWQAGIHTDSTHGAARVSRIDTERLRNELDKGNIVIVAGFQGVNKYEDITTLGRGGSDTSAVALAAALNADLCQIYTDVDGVYTADPRIVPNAIKIDEITYDEMLELASLGANVLHNRSVEMAKKYNVNLEVLSSMTGAEGTIVKEVTDVEKLLIKGVTKDVNIARISAMGVSDQPGIAFRLFSLLAKHKVSVDIILQSVGRDGTQDISFTVAAKDADEVVRLLEERKDTLGLKSVICDPNVAKVSIVGAGMETHAGVASKMFEALGEANINIQMIATSEIKISVLIAEEEANKAVAAIHRAFYGE